MLISYFPYTEVADLIQFQDEIGDLDVENSGRMRSPIFLVHL